MTLVRRIMGLVLLLTVLLLSGCAMSTVDQLYEPPRRSAQEQELQKAIDLAMPGLEYCAPLSGENQQTVQMADLDGDGQQEYLLFARGTGEKPLQILIFQAQEESYVLMHRLESLGSAFELVEYMEMDGQPGQELVVGRQVSNQLPRSLTVYTFREGDAQQLLNVNYAKFLSCDLDADQCWELMVVEHGAENSASGTVVRYSYEDGSMERSREVSLSESAQNIKRIMSGCLYGGVPAVYVASAVDESAIITDVFAMKNGIFANISASNESGTSVQTLRNYYVYAEDIDKDGILELPSLISMVPNGDVKRGERQHLIRWYAMDIRGGEVDKAFTFHDLSAGWYLKLEPQWAARITVSQESGCYSFYLWNEVFDQTQKLFTIEHFTGAVREDAVKDQGGFILHRGEESLYAAWLEPAAEDAGVTQESLMDAFHLILRDWKTGETE